jgi:hypothetical protein
MKQKPLIFRQHAIKRMYERLITVNDIDTVLKTGQIIENYPTDMPYPSALWLGFAATRPIHLVAAETDENLIIITVYEPHPEKWMPDWKTRMTS